MRGPHHTDYFLTDEGVTMYSADGRVQFHYEKKEEEEEEVFFIKNK